MSQATPDTTPDDTSNASDSPSRTTHGNGRRVWAGRARWALAVAACLWLALCTAAGPIYRQFTWDPYAASITRFSARNLLIFLCTFCIYLLVVVTLVRFARGRNLFPAGLRARIRRLAAAWPDESNEGTATRTSTLRLRVRTGWRTCATTLRGLARTAGNLAMRGTDRWWKIMLVLLIGWFWVPATLLTAFGADLHNQFREFSWAWNQWTGLKQSYIGFFTFVPMDIYPTAHYLWPANPTYLTDQHNIVLTLFYGAVAAMSRYLTGSNDWGVIVLSAGQFVFAAFCLSACANRFFNRPWPSGTKTRRASAGALPRVVILLFLLVCPIVLFSTISLTKSPLFAFTFAWWFSVNHEILHTDTSQRRIRPRTLAALAVSTSVMLVSAKYAWYIVTFQFLLLVLTNRKRWKSYIVGLLLPVLVIHGGVAVAISSGAVIGGDPIESKGVQIQQIARVASLNPAGIPDSARRKLEPIFNLDQMGEAYFPQDADPAKSSGLQSKKVSYKWRSVSKADMTRFNSAWLQIVKANPGIATDALLSKTYGYFDITDQPYTSMTYYIRNAQITDTTSWISDWLAGWRADVVDFTNTWSTMPVLGWLIHGNTYVIATLLIGAAEVILRRWKTLVNHIPLLLLMGVMLTAPANNFERHMLPVVFVFGFVALTFVSESRGTRGTRGHGATRIEA